METRYSQAQAIQQNFTVRQAKTADIKAIRAIAQETWEITYAHTVLATNRARVIATSYSDEALGRSLRSLGRDNWFWVAEDTSADNTQVIGFVEVSLRTGVHPDAELTRIYVLPAWQHRGVGSALNAAMLTELRSLRPSLRPPRLLLAVAATNANAIAFYEARGFRYSRDFKANLPGQVLEMREYAIDV